MDNFNFNRDFFEGCAALGDEDGAALAWALLRYGYTGEEPDGLEPALKAAFSFARGRVDAMRKGAQGGKARKTVKVPKNTKRANEAPSQDPSEAPSEAPSQDPSEAPSEAHSETPSEDPSGQKEKEKEKEKEIASAISCAPEFPEPRPVEAEPPGIGEVRDYFGANCLRGDPEEFFDHFEAQGWVRGNGRPVADWRAVARQWSRRQAEFDQSKPPEMRAPVEALPVAQNAIDWEAELAKLEGGA